MAGCASNAYERLPREDSIRHLDELKKSYESIPNETLLVPTKDERGNVQRVSVKEIGTGTSERVLIFIHGVLSNHTMWRYIAGDLGRDFDLMLVDLPGCGQSDCPDPSVLGPGGYSPRTMARRLMQALRERLSRRTVPPRIVLVGHSLGGAIALRMVSDPVIRAEFPDVIERLDRLVLLAPLDVAVEKQDPLFKDIVELTSWKVSIASMTGMLVEYIARSVRDSSCEPGALPREAADIWIEIFRDPSKLRAAQAMIMQAVPWLDNGRPNWETIEHVVQNYASIDVPCLILWGARDEALPLSMGYKLQAEIPDAYLKIIPRSMHCLAAERPRVCARAIRDFIELDAEKKPGDIETLVLRTEVAMIRQD